MFIEEIDDEYWRDVDVLTVWQAAFAMCDIEPWDEPISAIEKLPEQVENMRAILLSSIPHYQTGQVFAQSGWSCKTQRPVQLFGHYFRRQSLIAWANSNLSTNKSPLFITDH